MANRSLCSTLKNTSGKAMTFSHLGAHGIDLDSNETVMLNGDIRDQLAGFPRKFAAFQSDLEEGRLELQETPAPHLYDDTNDVIRILVVDDEALGTADPAWHPSSNSSYLT